MKQKIRNAIAIVVVLAALGLAFSFATGSGSENVPAVKATPGSEADQVQKLREQLALPVLSEEGRQGLEEKLQIAERSATEQAAAGTAKRSVKNPPMPAAAPMAETDSELMEGIFEGSQGLVRPSQADITNVWQGRFDGVVYQVFAGASVEQPVKGMLIVAALEDDSPTGQRQMYTAPGDAAKLRIIRVEQGVLLLETDAGAQISFDLSSRQFSE